MLSCCTGNAVLCSLTAHTPWYDGVGAVSVLVGTAGLCEISLFEFIAKGIVVSSDCCSPSLQINLARKGGI